VSRLTDRQLASFSLKSVVEEAGEKCATWSLALLDRCAKSLLAAAKVGNSVLLDDGESSAEAKRALKARRAFWAASPLLPIFNLLAATTTMDNTISDAGGIS